MEIAPKLWLFIKISYILKAIRLDVKTNHIINRIPFVDNTSAMIDIDKLLKWEVRIIPGNMNGSK